MSDSTSRSPGEKAYTALRREVQAARLRVSIDKRRGRKPSQKLLALAELKLPPTLPADVFRPAHTKTVVISEPDGRVKTADAQESHSY